ncbi:HepT-like ribonuclease domain-containing protein [Cellulomonas composti]|uniref:DUF86 domain-containing protein n=1 Tax=Cellulomonas composti TaxID=266130 RepID=A0A511J9I9_9CELL|nr:HepT-like ribonuclease domain-containing protein [Cellulomonas composti]GEL94429.1 hypothetical protein CCO02nite_10870 [Cellulomonas composti]
MTDEEHAAEDERIAWRLADLAEFGHDAAYTVAQGLDAYLDEGPAGRVLRNNGRQILIQTATVVEKLPEDFKRAHPDVEWVRIARMHNLIAHHYDRVNDRLVFTALAQRVPQMLQALGIVA